ncbi:MAG: PEP/pyruvate-binding domain-containing protein [Actinomycetales bacterium]
MSSSERSGVVFTADPSTGDRDRLVIEAVLGRGEAVVRGLVVPDTYVLAREPLHIVSVRVGQRHVKIVPDPHGAGIEVPTSEDEEDERVLTSEEIMAVAQLGIANERAYGSPQGVEWAMADGHTWMVERRPLATLRLQGESLAERASDNDEGQVTPMSSGSDPQAAAEMPEERCRQLLSATRVSRVAFVDEGLPKIVVLNHAVDGDDVLFQTSEDTSLARLTAGGEVILATVEADSASVASHAGWSIIASGRMFRTTEAQIRHAPKPWRPEAVGVLLRLHVDEIHGQAVGPETG